MLTLRDSGEAPCGHVTGLIDQHLAEIDRRMAELRKTRTELRELARRAAGTDPVTCAEAGISSIFGALSANGTGGSFGAGSAREGAPGGRHARPQAGRSWATR
ncbi:MerR family DNA-binding protein [Streptomyces sp.]|uniref:MerR family DNA-binding protein n=1 Tax=Streptomyces sp. TaxID=1931 RepID=UPI0039C8D94D